LSHNKLFYLSKISLQNDQREIEKFIIRQPPKGEKDDYDSEWNIDGEQWRTARRISRAKCSSASRTSSTDAQRSRLGTGIETGDFQNQQIVQLNFIAHQILLASSSYAQLWCDVALYKFLYVVDIIKVLGKRFTRARSWPLTLACEFWIQSSVLYSRLSTVSRCQDS